jgi:hypothetical protein
MLGAAGAQHLEVLVAEARVAFLVDGVERVHEAVAEGVGVDVEGRVDEVRDVGPEGLVARREVEGVAQRLRLHRHPERVDVVGGELALRRASWSFDSKS